MEPQYVAIHRDIGREIIGIRCEKMGYTDIYIYIQCIYSMLFIYLAITYYIIVMTEICRSIIPE